MTRPQKTLLAWSSGKDSAYALWTLQQDPQIELVGLLTTLNGSVDRVAMHGVHSSVLEAQAAAAGLPLIKVPLPDPCSNEEYEALMLEVVRDAKTQGVERMAFGDLFLAEVRKYREAHLFGTGITPLFPVWGHPTPLLARQMVDEGYDAIVTCVDTEQLDRSFVGRRFDHSLLDELPPTADPCAENGEFHTLAIAGPMFDRPLDVEVGEIVDKGRFVWVDVKLRARQ